MEEKKIRMQQCPYCLYDIPIGDAGLKHMNKCCKQDMRFIKRNPDKIKGKGKEKNVIL